MIRLLATLLGLAFSLSSTEAFAACSNPSGNEGSVIYSASAKQLQFCNGTNWVNTGATVQSVGGGGGGVPTYAGITSASYNGDMGGMFAADANCASEYSGSRMMRSSDIKHILSSVEADSASFSSSAWVYCDTADCIAYGGGSATNTNCGNFTSNTNNSNNLGSWLTPTGVTRHFQNCSASKKIVCVTD